MSQTLELFLEVTMNTSSGANEFHYVYQFFRYMTHVFPCNGTKHYTPEHSDDNFTLEYEVNMQREIRS